MYPVQARYAAALDVLGLGADADRDQVIRAYRRLARATHPDVSDGPDAAAGFRTVAHAYRLALDAIQRGDNRAGTTEPQTPGGQRVSQPSMPRASQAAPLTPWAARGSWSEPDAAIVAGPVQISPLPPQEPANRPTRELFS